MDGWIWMPLLLALGYVLGRLHQRRWRRDRLVALARRLQLVAQRIEMQGLRRKGRRPSLRPWQKWLLGLPHGCCPVLTRYSLLRPETLIGWHRRYVRRYWWLISAGGRRTVPGRPRLPESVCQIIVDIKRNNPRYGAARIAALVSKQLGAPLSASTVRNVLQRHAAHFPPTPKGGQTWATFLANHREVLGAMDFKVTFDWRARPLFILSILAHHRRKLLHCRATYHPSSQWVAQQLREALPFDEGPRSMLVDHDSIFVPVIARTLPSMGIEVVRTAVQRPWQNGTIERFNRTLQEELLGHIIPTSEHHLNRLLAEFQRFYNAARPHRANGGLTPEQAAASNEAAFAPCRQDPAKLRAQAIPWLGGLHHSYRRAA